MKLELRVNLPEEVITSTGDRLRIGVFITNTSYVIEDQETKGALATRNRLRPPNLEEWTIAAKASQVEGVLRVITQVDDFLRERSKV